MKCGDQIEINIMLVCKEKANNKTLEYVHYISNDIKGTTIKYAN